MLLYYFPSVHNRVWALQLIPGFSLYAGLYEFSAYAFLGSYRKTRGMTMENLYDAGNQMRIAWAIMAVEWVVLLPLSVYLVSADMILSMYTLLYLLYVSVRKSGGEKRAFGHVLLYPVFPLVCKEDQASQSTAGP
jgi:hypothetical protein